MKTYDVIVIGAGAAGLMCAAVAAQRGRSTLVLDHNDVVGRKILISGGGRCNFTNREVAPSNYLSQNPHFAKSALSRFQPEDFLKIVHKHSIEYYEKTLGQLFCRNSAKEIVQLLVKECNDSGTEWALGQSIKSVSQENDLFKIETNKAEFSATSLVVATGGLSIPKIGATDFGYRLARQFGLKVIATYPALDGFRLKTSDRDFLSELSGVSCVCVASAGGKSFEESILFTHSGLSGPVALQASLYWQANEPLTLNLLPSLKAHEFILDKKLSQPNSSLKTILSEKIPTRLAETLIQHIAKLENKPIKQYTHKELENISHLLNQWVLYPESTIGYQKAEVTRGGVDTNELSSKTFESKKVSGLYFIGEVVDVTGQLGGFNFQWAWASGTAAGQSV